jgi:hypothetical protein
MIDVSKLRNNEVYYIEFNTSRFTNDAGFAIWNAKINAFADCFGELWRPNAVTAVFGPVDYQSLPLITKASER